MKRGQILVIEGDPATAGGLIAERYRAAIDAHGELVESGGDAGVAKLLLFEPAKAKRPTLDRRLQADGDFARIRRLRDVVVGTELECSYGTERGPFASCDPSIRRCGGSARNWEGPASRSRPSLDSAIASTNHHETEEHDEEGIASGVDDNRRGRSRRFRWQGR
jgi:hypothetical protein